MTLIEQLKRDEGLRLVPYLDTVQKMTIGYGRNLNGTGISRDEAEYLLANDIARCRQDVARMLPWSTGLCEARQAVLQNMAFNMGIHKLLEFDRTLDFIESGKFEDAADEMLRSKWARQVGERAIRLSVQMRKGEWQ